MPQSEHWLVKNIESFIAKFYTSKLIKGILIVLGCMLIVTLILVLAEYFLYFNAAFKTTLLAIIGLTALTAAVFYIIIPILQISKLGKRMSKKDAAALIGTHFPEIKDKLLNILELKNQQTPDASQELIQASIEQKTSALAPFQFKKAIDFKSNRKWLPLAIIPLVVGLLIFFLRPQIFNDAGYRLTRPNQNFVKPAPFKFILKNQQLSVPQFSDIELALRFEGKNIPQEAKLIIENEALPMRKDEKGNFLYSLKKIDKNYKFHFKAAGYSSKSFDIKILHLPSFKKSKMYVNYPAYTGRNSAVVNGVSDLTVPEGTQIRLEVVTENTSTLSYTANEQTPIPVPQKNNSGVYSFSSTPSQDTRYNIFIGNEHMPTHDSLSYTITISKDNPPTINIKALKDNISKEQVALAGSASDDYGLAKAAFFYQIKSRSGKTRSKSIPLKITGKVSTPIQYYFDIGTLKSAPTDRITYYIKVWDIKGQTAQSKIFEHQLIKDNKVQKTVDENLEQVNNELAKSQSEAKELDKKIEKLKENALKQESMSEWEKQQNLEQLQKQQEAFKKSLENIKNRMKLQDKLQQDKKYNQQIEEKKEAIKEQLDNLLNKELEEQMKKLQKLLERKQQPDENSINDLEKMQEQNKLVKMDMERIQEMIKQLETQMKMEDLANKMNELAQKQDKLAAKTNNKEQDNKQLKKEQEQLKKELEQLNNEDLHNLKKDAENQDLNDEQDLMEGAEKDMQESANELNNNNRSKSGKAQKGASKKLKQAAGKMMEKANGMDMEQIDIDIKATRQLLTNLLRMSFDQEQLIPQTRNIKNNTLLKTTLKEQYRLRVNAQQVKDSLFSLSKRIAKLGPTINKESLALEKRLAKTTAFLEDRQISRANIMQRYAMTNMNNLALLLNELLENLMQQQASAMPSSGSSSGMQKGPKMPNPGSGKGGKSPGEMMQDIITGQKKMGKGMSELKKGNSGQSKNGNSKGNQKKGDQKGNKGKGRQRQSKDGELSERLSRMAFEQEKLRDQVNQLNSILNSKGIKGNAQLIKEIQDKMNRIETDLVNKKLNSLEQQQSEILTRMLKAQEAIRKQEQDNKRQGEAAQDQPRPIPPKLQEFMNKQKSIKELFRTTPPRLQPFYKKLSEDYLNKVGT